MTSRDRGSSGRAGELKEERRRDDGDKPPSARDTSSSRAAAVADERVRGEKDRQRERIADEHHDDVIKKPKLSAATESRRGEHRDEPRTRDERREDVRRDDGRREKDDGVRKVERDMRASSAASSGSDKQLNSTDPSPRRVEDRG